jgi:hypothetical protein
VARHNLSAAGRLRCREAGSANLKRYQETHADVRAEIELAVSKFRAELVEHLGGEAAITAIQGAGIASACSLYTSILQTQRSLLSAQSHRARVAAWQAQLPITRCGCWASTCAARPKRTSRPPTRVLKNCDCGRGATSSV